MDTKEGLAVNKYGQVMLSSNDLRELLLQGKSINHLYSVIDDEIELFQKYQADLLPDIITFSVMPEENMAIEEFHRKCANEWTFPDKYKHIDVLDWLLKKCRTQKEIERVRDEYALYEERDLIIILRLFIFLVDYLRENKFVWGVGRGSSVSSYILFLIGVHKVDSIKYNLDIREYLR